jgi:hypothetical protein
MNWTPELDARLIELHEKRLGNRFIASWLRLDPTLVRARLAELGVVKPARNSEAKAAAPALAAPPQLPAVAVQIMDLSGTDGADASDEGDDDDEAGALISRRGCPRGHLVPEDKIAALYRSAGGRY